MRKLALVGLVIALIAALTPAAAAVPGSATIRVVNALADRSIDVYVDATLEVAGTAALSVSDPSVVTAGSLTFSFFTTGDGPPSAPTASLTTTVDSGDDVLVIAHQLDDASFAVSVIQALPVTLELSESYTQVIHAADAPQLEITELNNLFITPAEGFTLDSGQAAGTQFSVPGTNSFQFVDATGPTTVFGPADVDIADGSYNAVILAGSQPDGTLTIISFQIGGLWDTVYYSALLSGDNEVPPVASDDRGRAALVDFGTELWATITIQPGSASTVTAAHIHAGQPGDNGPVLAVLLDAAGFPELGGGRLVQSFVTDADLAVVDAAAFDGNYSTLIRMLKAGEAYINVHTSENPAGEVRGQIEPLTIPMEPALFPDIETNVHRNNISIIAEAGIALGRPDGNFEPNANVTRGQLATFLARIFGLVPIPGSVFSDTAGSVHEANINAVAGVGIVQGRTDGTFGPNDPVTRGQAAAMGARALAIDANIPPPTPFTDIAGHTFEREIALLFGIEAVRGCTTTAYCPDNPLTRGQVSSVLSRAFGWEVMLNV